MHFIKNNLTGEIHINSLQYMLLDLHSFDLIQHYVIKFVSDLSQVGGFLRGPPVSSTNKTDRHDIAEILLKVALNTITIGLTIDFIVK